MMSKLFAVVLFFYTKVYCDVSNSWVPQKIQHSIVCEVTAEYPKRYSMVLCVFLFRPSETGTWTLGLCLLLCARWWLQSLQILTSTSWVSLHLVLYNNTFSRKIVLMSFGWCSFLSRNVQICVACSSDFVGHYHLVRFQTCLVSR